MNGWDGGFVQVKGWVCTKGCRCAWVMGGHARLRRDVRTGKWRARIDESKACTKGMKHPRLRGRRAQLGSRAHMGERKACIGESSVHMEGGSHG
jgi:hypothetical protein